MPGTDLIVPAGQLTTVDRLGDELDEAVAAFAASAKSAATRKAYVSDGRDFVRWCTEQGSSYDPATPRTVCRYLAHLVARGLSVSTIDRRVAAITAIHRSRGHDTPTGAQEVRTVLDGIRRTVSKPPKKKRALTDDLVAKVLRKTGTDLAGLRDRAMIGLCFAAALRRSELVALDVADIEPHHRGLIVTVRRSKTDQQGKGHKVAILDGKLKVPQAVQAWLDAAGIVDGPVFRGCDCGKVLDARYDGGSFARMLKRRVEAVGLDPKLFSGHSCRRGFATSADEAVADLQSIAGQLRHRKLDTTRGYTEAGDLFRKNAGRGVV